MAALDPTPGGRLAELLEQWRRDIVSVPMPRLVEVATAVAIVRAARDRAGASPDQSADTVSEV